MSIPDFIFKIGLFQDFIELKPAIYFKKFQVCPYSRNPNPWGNPATVSNFDRPIGVA